jgi:hypothetical protein
MSWLDGSLIVVLFLLLLMQTAIDAVERRGRGPRRSK